MRLKNGKEVTIELLTKAHEKNQFSCEQETLNRFLKTSAGQDSRRGFSRTYVATHTGNNVVFGYYSLNSGQVRREIWPDIHKLPRYDIPVIHLGRLAVDNAMQGLGLGRLLLFHALALAMTHAEAIGAHALTVDAIDHSATDFYLHHDFLPLTDDKTKLFLEFNNVKRSMFPQEIVDSVRQKERP